jgi:hypothetical protein
MKSKTKPRLYMEIVCWRSDWVKRQNIDGAVVRYILQIWENQSTTYDGQVVIFLGVPVTSSPVNQVSTGQHGVRLPEGEDF